MTQSFSPLNTIVMFLVMGGSLWCVLFALRSEIARADRAWNTKFAAKELRDEERLKVIEYTQERLDKRQMELEARMHVLLRHQRTIRILSVPAGASDPENGKATEIDVPK
jgi:hypothetical protein